MRNRQSRTRLTVTRKGFTLIELLVVIAIISILAAILFPVFATAREKARQITCASNLKQLGTAFEMYTDDSDEYLPGCADGPGTTTPMGPNITGGWVVDDQYNAGLSGQNTTSKFDVTKGSIYPYVKNKQVYVCPDDNQGQTNGLSYAINSCVEQPQSYKTTNSTDVVPGLNSSQFSDTSGIMLLCEEAAGEQLTTHTPPFPNSVTGTTDDGYLDFAYGFTHNPPGYPNFLSTRHGNGSEVLFLDGHVKWLNEGALYNPDPVGTQPNGWGMPFYSIMTGTNHTTSCQ